MGQRLLFRLPWPANTGSPETVIEGLRVHMLAEGLNSLQQAANIARLKSEINEYFKEGSNAETLKARNW